MSPSAVLYPAGTHGADAAVADGDTPRQTTTTFTADAAAAAGNESRQPRASAIAPTLTPALDSVAPRNRLPHSHMSRAACVAAPVQSSGAPAPAAEAANAE